MARFIFLLALLGSHLGALEITNHKDQETIRYQVALLKGTVAEGTRTLTIKNPQAPTGTLPIQAVISGTQFKALVPLSPGKNTLILSSDKTGKALLFTIAYEPQKNDYFVRLIWLTDNTGEDRYATPDPKMPQDYENRLRTAGLLMQTFTAETMNDQGHGRRTFRLERDEKGKIIVHKMKGKLTAREYYDLGDSGKYWSQVRQETFFHFKDNVSKNIVLAAFTRKSPGTGKMLGHTALGGANLGLFGSASIFSWPQKIGEAAAAFQNSDTFDASAVHNDSAGRDNYWGLASTTMGATLHELGHTFTLYHSRDPRAIMSRGFDRFNRAFTFADPPSSRNRELRPFTTAQEAYFSPPYAASLRWSKWFSLDRVISEKDDLRITYNREQKSVTVTSSQGVRWLGFITKKEHAQHFREFKGDNPPKSVTLSIDELTKITDGLKVDRIDARSSTGRTSVYNFRN